MATANVIQPSGNGYKLAVPRSAVERVAVADIDLVLVLKSGARLILVGAALGGMSGQPPVIEFSDGAAQPASDLLKSVNAIGARQEESPLTAPEASQVNEEKKTETESPVPGADASPSETPSNPPATPVVDLATKALQALDKSAQTVAVAEATPPPPEPPLVSAPPERAGTTPQIVGIVGASEFRSLALFNLTGVRSAGNVLYGTGGDAISATDAQASVQSAPEHIIGTSGNDVIHGEDPDVMGAGFAKTLSMTVGNARVVESLEISGLPAGFSFAGATPSGGVWSLPVPGQNSGSSFDGVYVLSQKLSYPTDLASDSSFVMHITLTVTDLKGNEIVFNRTVTVIAREVSGADDLLVSTQGTDFTLIIPARGLANVIDGGAGDDQLYGGAANDTLIGGTGADTLTGGRGDDAYSVDNAGDVVVEAAGEGADSVTASVSFTLAANVENLTLTGTAVLSGTGNAQDNRLTANDAGNSLDGAAGADTLTGGVGNDTLDGGAGADSMAGGAGDDTYVVDSAGDVVSETLAGAAGGTDTVKSGIEYTLGANVENLTLTGTAVLAGHGNSLDNRLTANDAGNLLDGAAGNDTLQGGDGNDTLDGGAGADSMVGGAGDDTYYVDALADVVIEALAGTAGGTDTVITTLASYALGSGSNVENLTLAGTGPQQGTGNELDNILTASDHGDTLDGGAGNDTLVGGAGNDTFYVDSTADVVQERLDEGLDQVYASASYTLSANADNLTLTGNAALSGTGNSLDNVITANAAGNDLHGAAGDDTLLGGDGNDTLDGGSGVDSMVGGAGDDTYTVDAVGDVVVEALAGAAGGNDTVFSSVSLTLAVNVEDLTLTGTAALTGTGNDLDNVLVANGAGNALHGGAGNDTLQGGAGNDTLNGGTGDDSMVGGGGDDTYYVDSAADVINEAPGAGTDTVITALDNYTLAADLENLTLQGSAQLSGYGNAQANVLTANDAGNLLSGGQGRDTLHGGAGDDTLDGGTAGDVMVGGIGNDLYQVDDTNDQVIEDLAGTAGGNDTVETALDNYTLGTNVENLTLKGSSALAGNGNDLDNVLRANDFGDTLSGLGGRDTLVGGLGADSLLGGLGNDSLVGAAGNDTLDGGAGSDTLEGGAGDDLYRVDDVADVVTEYVSGTAGGTDTVAASVNYTLSVNVEALVLTGSSVLTGTGNADNNTLVANDAGNALYGAAGNDTLLGGTGNDTLDGGAGIDSMAGGAGDDFYVVDNSADAISEAAGGGLDTVSADVSYTLSDNIEQLLLTGAAVLAGTGNGRDNLIVANDAGNTLLGAAGNDTLQGGAGNDILDGGPGDDSMVGGLGDDVYYVDSTGDVVLETLALGGTDTVMTALSNYTLGLNVDNLTLTGTAVLAGYGNSAANVLIANNAGNLLDGAAGDDTLTGGAGNDTLEGGSGADAMAGGAGDDIYEVDNTGDLVTEAAGEGTDRVNASISYVLAANVDNLTLTGTAVLTGTGNSGDNQLTANGAGNALNGAAGNDTLTGGAGNDTLDGGAGNDAMAGGAGNDLYTVDSVGDVVTESLVGTAGGTDTVSASVSYVLGSNLENLILTGSAVLSGSGNGDNNVITANNAGNTLAGGAGNDTLRGGAGNDTLDGGTGADAMEGGGGNDLYQVDDAGDTVTELSGGGTDTVSTAVNLYVLAANVENLTLTGNAALTATGNTQDNVLTANSAGNALYGVDGNDTLTGGAGNDTLDGGAGADSMAGGAGNDVYYVDNTADVVTEAAASGTDLVYASISHTLAANVDNLTLTGTAMLTGTGNGDNNVITANGAGNALYGAAGADTLIGGAGNDTLDGGIGADSMAGGAGNDVYYVDNIADVVTEAAGAGTDTAWSSVSFTLGANVDNLTLTGSAVLSGTGNGDNNILVANNAGNTLAAGAGNDTLTGGTGNDTLDGGTGNDSMAGGAGDDTYLLDSAADVISEAAGAGTDTVSTALNNYTLGANLENLVLTGTSALVASGNGLDNVMTANSAGNALSGGAGNDSLVGGSGADTLDGGTGADTLVGGAGNDIYVVDNVGDAVTEALNEGTDLVNASVSFTLAIGGNVENLTLTGSSGLSGTGNELDNTITGNSGANLLTGGAGNDTLIGGAGADTLVGGQGNDSYFVDNIGDIVIESAGEGTDQVSASVSITLGANVENLTLTGAAVLAGTGNCDNNTLVANNAGNALYGAGGNDTLTGGTGNDTLDGGTGNDSMAGGAGNDTYVVDSLLDVVTEAAGAGTDTVSTALSGYTLAANVDNLTLTGSAALTATGNALDNVITANTGADTLSGGLGNDTFIVGNLAGSADGGGGTDTLRVTGLTASSTLNLSSLMSRVTTMEVIDVKDAANEFISVTASAIQSIVGQGNSSLLTLRLDSGDSVVLSATDHYSVSAGGAYTFYNADPTIAGSYVVAQLAVTTA